MKKYIIISFLFLIVACGGGGGNEAIKDSEPPKPESESKPESEVGQEPETNTKSLFVDYKYNIISEKITSYSYKSFGDKCNIIVYKVPYKETENYKEKALDILEELDDVKNCEIKNRNISVSLTTTKLCISKNNGKCLLINI